MHTRIVGLGTGALLAAASGFMMGCSEGNSAPSDGSPGSNGVANTTSPSVSGAGGMAATSGASMGVNGTVTATTGGGSGATATGSASGTSAATGSTSAGGSGTETGSTAGTTGSVIPSGDLFTVEHELASDVDPNAPGTVGIVTWSVDLDTVESASIEFGLDTAYGTAAPVDLNAAGFRTLLLGMKPSSTYHFRVVAVAGGATYTSDDYSIQTGPPTDSVALGDFTIHDEAAHERGFIVASYWQGGGSSVAFIIDADGEIVWWYDSGANGIARARMSADGQNMWLITPNNMGGPLQRVSMDTLDAETYSGTVGSHDITPVSGATMAYLEYGETDCDSIFEIDPSGTTREVFESDDFLTGMCHGNALRYSQAEDVYTFSDVQQDILIVNREGGVEWRISEILDGGIDAYGGRQHGHHLLDESIVVFANGWNGQNNSVAVEYDLTGQEIWRYDGGEYSANLGDVQRLPGGNTLVTYSNASVVHEVDPENNLVMQFDGGGSRIGYTLWRETLYGPPPDIQQ
jgi:hypothetical protein